MQIKHLALAAMAVALTTTAVSASDYSDGIALFKAKNYRGAAAKFEAAMKANPRDGNAVYYCALAQQMASNRARARQLFEYVISCYPGSSVAMNAQTALQQLGGVGSAGGGGSSSSSGSGVSTMGGGGGRSSDPAYLAGLPDEIKVPLLRKHVSSKAAYLEANINGRPIVVHLDTGAYSTVFGANQLQEMGITRPGAGRQFEVGGVGDAQGVKAWHQKIDLKVGLIYRRDFPITVQESLDGEPLLGQDFLQDFNTTVDDSGGQIVFRKKSARAAVTARGTKDIPFRVDPDGGRHLLVDAIINGRKYVMYFDTGAYGIALSMKDCKKLGIPEPEGPPTGRSTGVLGSTDTWDVTLNSIKVGAVTRENFPAHVVGGSTMEHPLLGQEFFGNYKYTVDRSAGVIHLVED